MERKEDDMNNWYVITGAPSSGKTTTLEILKKRGYETYYEWARIYIDQEMEKGKTIQEIRKNEFIFQQKILDLKIDFEKKLDKNRLVFMERGIPDSTAFMQLCGKPNDPTLKKALKNCSYKKIFLMELFNYKKDYARTESQEEAKILETLLEKSYKDVSLEVIKVPKMSPNKRVDFILENL